MSENFVTVSIDALKVHPRNSEFFDDISGQEYEQFKESIKKDGILSEILISPDMTIISGHQRYRAAKELGIKMVKVKVMEDLTDEDEKLRLLITSNFARIKNDEQKQRKAIAEYVKLCGYKNGGNREAQSHNENVLTLDEIAKQLGMSKANLTRALSIERNLTDDMKDLLDTGVISKTLAADVISFLSEEEQEELITKLDVTQKYTQRQMQKYIDEIKKLKDDPQIQVPDDYEEVKKNVKKYQYDYEKEKINSRRYQEDYENAKRKAIGYQKDYEDMRSQLDRMTKEYQDLQNKMQNKYNSSPQEEYNQRLKEDAVTFQSKVSIFIEETGGYIWLADKINEIPALEKNMYIRSAQLIKEWADTLLYNINNKLHKM